MCCRPFDRVLAGWAVLLGLGVRAVMFLILSLWRRGTAVALPLMPRYAENDSAMVCHPPKLKLHVPFLHFPLHLA